ncbi:histidinol-phosphatase [Thiovibrio frasassiensis]|uniref:Histidinol-phosphatase n=1 Tax=Thiovibrio frasassiensis TaxID=2984131 RepID=A0A9X4MHG0_9BACT|nr:histidinol-phosphatase [Thiovibrio frasassiensis]MDG4476411.1 histidinol-phosphatase [Thiovibrio frasassiensis]
MLINTKSDGHVHTRLCHHASGEMEEYVRAAISKGLEELIFLEHLECGIHYPEDTWLSEEDFVVYQREGQRLRQVYGDRIFIGIGVEVGYNPKQVPAILDFLKQYPWDRVGLSFHYYEIKGHHYNVVSRRKFNLEPLGKHGVERVISDYFSTLLEAVSLLPATVLCHLDAVLRHHPEVQFNAAHQRQIREIFQAMREKGMALEVNTSGFSHRGEQYPAQPILEEAIALGVPLVAGSDAHRPGEVGRFFERLG